MSTDSKFVDGLRVYVPNEKAPDFVIADLKFDDNFVAWLAERGNSARVTIKRSRAGKLYAAENDWTPKDAQPAKPKAEPQGGGFQDDSIPF